MYSTLNMGLGMCAVVAPGDVKAALALLNGRGVQSWEVGRIAAGKAGAEAEAIIGS